MQSDDQNFCSDRTKAALFTLYVSPSQMKNKYFRESRLFYFVIVR